MNIPKSISNFLYIHKGYLDNGEWDTLFSLANHEHISIFELSSNSSNAISAVSLTFKNVFINVCGVVSSFIEDNSVSLQFST